MFYGTEASSDRLTENLLLAGFELFLQQAKYVKSISLATEPHSLP